VLLGLGRSDEAKDLANKWLSYGESPEAYKALANASLRSGKAIRDNLLYAKKAYALSKSKDTETTIMLARMLSKADPKSKEAAQVLETALRTASNPEDAKQLGAAMREIQQRQRKSSKRN
jgi:hypothetical protein